MRRAIRSRAKNKLPILLIEDGPDVASVVSALIAEIATVTLARNYWHLRKKHTAGPPQATETHTVEDLQEQNISGLYRKELAGI